MRRAACPLATSVAALVVYFYASRVPERWAPGRFDLVLQSHQLWHLCVLAAIFAWYDGILRARALLHDEGCAAFVSSR